MQTLGILHFMKCRWHWNTWLCSYSGLDGTMNSRRCLHLRYCIITEIYNYLHYFGLTIDYRPPFISCDIDTHIVPKKNPLIHNDRYFMPFILSEDILKMVIFVYFIALLHCILLRDNFFCLTLTSMSELFSKVASRSIIDFTKETGFYRKI